jgi:hypothetical protein
MNFIILRMIFFLVFCMSSLPLMGTTVVINQNTDLIFKHRELNSAPLPKDNVVFLAFDANNEKIKFISIQNQKGVERGEILKKNSEGAYEKVMYSNDSQQFWFYDLDGVKEMIFRPPLGWFGTIQLKWKRVIAATGETVGDPLEITVIVRPTTNEDQELSLSKWNFLDNFPAEELSAIVLVETPKRGVLKRLGNEIKAGDVLDINTEMADTKEVMSFTPMANSFGHAVIKWSGNDDLEIRTITVNITEDKAQDTLRVWMPSLTVKEDAPFSITPNVRDPNIKQHTIDIFDDGGTLRFVLKNEFLDTVYDGPEFPTVTKNVGYHLIYSGNYTLFFNKAGVSNPQFVFNAYPTNFEKSLYGSAIGKRYYWPIGHTDTSDDFDLKCQGCFQITSDFRTYTIPILDNPIFEFKITGAPSFMSVDPSTGIIRGTPDYTDIAVHPNIILSARSQMASDPQSYESSDSFFIHVENINDQPQASNIEITVDEGKFLTLNLMDYVTDEESPKNTLIYSLDEKKAPKHGVAILKNKSMLTYLHSGYESLKDTFNYYVSDGNAVNGQSEIATVTVTIVPANDPPVLVNKYSIIDVNQSYIDIDLTQIGSDPEKDALTFEILDMPLVGTAQILNGVTLRYSYSDFESLVQQRVATINVIGRDLTLSSKPATVYIYPYFKEKTHPSSFLKLESFGVETPLKVGSHYKSGDVIWDINNRVTESDHIMVNNRMKLISYGLINHDNAPVEISESSGKIIANNDFNAIGVSGEYRLTVTAKVELDNQIIGVQCSGKFVVKKSVEKSSDVDSIDTYIIEKSTIFNSVIQKKDVDFNINPNEDITIASAVEMNQLSIGGRDKQKIVMKDTDVVLNRLILGDEKQHQVALDIDGSDLNVNDEVWIGRDGSATLNIKGRAVVKKMTIGKNKESYGSLTILGLDTKVTVDELVVGDQGSAYLYLNGGEIVVNQQLNVGSDSTLASVELSNGRMESRKIVLHPDSVFKLSGGVLRTEEFGGNFVNSGGTLSIGERPGNVFQVQNLGHHSVSMGGHTVIIGNFNQEYGDTSVSNVLIKLNGPPEKEDLNGRLVVRGIATLGGQLTVTADGDWVFENGQQFKLIEATEIHNNFSILSLPDLDPNLEWDVRQLSQTGVISVVPAGSIPIQPIIAYVYPNPLPKSTTDAIISYGLKQHQSITIDIYNMFGKKVHSQFYQSGNNGGKSDQNFVPMPLELIKKLSIGPYFLVIHNGYQVVARGKFVIK